MLTIEGLAAVALTGLLGALISEALRMAAYVKEKGTFPPAPFLFVSLIYVLLGLGVLFFGTSPAKNALEVAELGAAFPLLWSAGVRAVAGGTAGFRAGTSGWLQYTGWRF